MPFCINRKPKSCREPANFALLVAFVVLGVSGCSKAQPTSVLGDASHPAPVHFYTVAEETARRRIQESGPAGDPVGAGITAVPDAASGGSGVQLLGIFGIDDEGGNATRVVVGTRFIPFHSIDMRKAVGVIPELLKSNRGRVSQREVRPLKEPLPPVLMSGWS